MINYALEKEVSIIKIINDIFEYLGIKVHFCIHRWITLEIKSERELIGKEWGDWKGYRTKVCSKCEKIVDEIGEVYKAKSIAREKMNKH